MKNEIGPERILGLNPLVFGAIFFLIPCLGFGPLKFDEQQLSLAGIEKIQVVVKIGLSREGPTRQSLQDEVEKELVEGGVHIVQDVDEKEGEGGSLPVLYVEVAVWKNGENPYVYFVGANLYQLVHLDRNDGIKTQAATWQASLIGEGTIERIRDDVARIAKSFASQFKLVNNPGE